ncbi:hypothetical protein GCM10009422_06890 [Brevundimonas kwangchunensis]|uniref:DUF4435 domain-containing protein n=1 Tax=Brevundimonas kwangchunensis TaxID=322163 RepID=A0ABP3RV91_9CAUL
MTDRAIRNLAHLRKSASTARVLNLLKVYNDHRRDPDYAEKPIFRTVALNRALIIKHRLRRNEFDAFHLRRQVSTKVVIPIDSDDLKTGGRFVFVDQRNFERLMQESFGIEPGHPDLVTLRLMDALPSLDPFLLREQLKRGGVEPAACYFSISDADLDRMLAFVESEIRPLVTLSVGDDIETVGSTRRLAGKILSSDPGDRMEALRETLQLHPDEYQEGVFCWKGFLYYKWVLTSLLGDVTAVADAVATVKPLGKVDRTAREYLDRGRRVLHERIMKTCEEVSATLRIYDDAYADLTVHGKPAAFRDFLLRAPRLFTRLGEQLGAVQHVISFWRFRFAPGAPPVSVDELIDVFMDFETGLADRDQELGQLMVA